MIPNVHYLNQFLLLLVNEFSIFQLMLIYLTLSITNLSHSLSLFLLDLILSLRVVLTRVRAPLVAHAWYAVAHSLPLFLLDPDIFFFDYQHSLSDAILLYHHEDSCHYDLWIAASIYLVSSVIK